MSEPIQGRAHTSPSSQARIVMPFKPPSMTGQGLLAPQISTAKAKEVNESTDHWLGDGVSIKHVSSSIPEMRFIAEDKISFPGTSIPDRYVRIYSNGGIAYRAVTEDWQQTAEDWAGDYEASKPNDFLDETTVQLPGDPPLSELANFFPGTPLELNETEEINPPCGGGGDGSPRPEYGVLYPRKT